MFYSFVNFNSFLDLFQFMKKADYKTDKELCDTKDLINSSSDLLWSVNPEFQLIASNLAFVENMFKKFNLSLNYGDNLLNKEYFEKDRKSVV